MSVEKIIKSDLRKMFYQYDVWLKKIEKALNEKPYLYENISNSPYSLEIEKIKLIWNMIKALVECINQNNEITIEDVYTLLKNCLGLIRSILDYERIELDIEA
jgi:hypothetical protein